MSLPHSPTPWTHVPKDGEPDEIHDATGDCVADVHGTGEFKAEGRANAKIMTVAPELLNSLLLMIQSHGTDLRDRHGYCNCGGCESARAVLAKINQ